MLSLSAARWTEVSIMPEIMQQEILTVKEIQHILRIGQVNAYQLIRTPGFPVVKIGRAYRIPRSSFYDWLSRQKCAAEEE